MATVSISNWDLKQTASISDPGSTPTAVESVQPLKITWGNSSSNTGSGDCAFTQDINSRDEFVVTEEDESTTRPYQVTYFDDSVQEAWVWVYGVWDRDATDQIVVALGSGNGTDYSFSGAGSNPWTQVSTSNSIYNFDESSGSLVDYSGNNRDSTSTNGTSYQVDSLLGHGRGLDGNSDWIKTPANTNLFGGSDQYTMRYIVKPRNSNSVTEEFFSGVGEYDYRLDYNQNQQWQYQTNDGNNVEQITTSGYSANQFYVVDLKYDGNGNMEWWVDGTKVVSQSTQQDYLTKDGTVNAFGIRANNEDQNFDAVFDHVMFLSEKTSDAESVASYDATPLGNQTFFQWSGEQSTALQLSVSETLGVNELRNEVQNLSRSFSEQVTADDFKSKNFLKNIFEEAGVKTEFAREVDYFRSIIESFGVNTVTRRKIKKALEQNISLDDFASDNAGYIVGVVDLDGSTIENANVYVVKAGEGSFQGDDSTAADGSYMIGKVTDQDRYLVAVDFESEGTDYGKQKSIEVDFS